MENKISEYSNFPYEKIIERWNKDYYDGVPPTKADSSTRTYELAMALRNITGYDTRLLNSIIPTYEGMTDALKAQKIAAAVNAKQTQMPTRLRDVLTELKAEFIENKQLMDTVEDMEAEDDLLYFRRRPQKCLAMGLRESAVVVKNPSVMPMLVYIAPLIGGLATNVRLGIDGKMNWLNLISYIEGDSGSNKGRMMVLYNLWMWELKAEDKVTEGRQREYFQLLNKKKNAKEQPEEPVFKFRLIAVNNTPANVATQLDALDTEHAISTTDEADEINAKWTGKEKMELSVMLRKAYDAAEYHRNAKSLEAARCHREHLKWNVALLGTQDALYRLVNQYTDGLQSRLALGRMPDNTYAKNDKDVTLTAMQVENIHNVAHLLRVMRGDLVLPKLEARSDAWTEGIRLRSIKDADKALAKCRMRDHGIAMRIVCCMMLCRVAEKLIKKHGLRGAEERLKQDEGLLQSMMLKEQTKEMLEAYDVIADYIIDNDLIYFRERLENSYESKDHKHCSGLRTTQGKNDSIYERLPNVFSRAELIEETRRSKGNDFTDNTIKQMIKNWKKSDLIIAENGNYRKTA